MQPDNPINENPTTATRLHPLHTMKEELHEEYVPPLWNNSIDVASSSILANDFTWRAALLGLRALHPQPHAYHTTTSLEAPIDPADKPRPANMPLRLLQMKEHMAQVMQEQEALYNERLEAKFEKEYASKLKNDSNASSIDRLTDIHGRQSRLDSLLSEYTQALKKGDGNAIAAALQALNRANDANNIADDISVDMDAISK